MVNIQFRSYDVNVILINYIYIFVKDKLLVTY